MGLSCQASLALLITNTETLLNLFIAGSFVLYGTFLGGIELENALFVSTPTLV
jgi:hypothetical protein